MTGKQIWPPRISMAKLAVSRPWFKGEPSSYTTRIISPLDAHKRYRFTYKLTTPSDTPPSLKGDNQTAARARMSPRVPSRTRRKRKRW